MTYRLLALNIDGTLIGSNAKISKQTKAAIEYVKQKNVYVTLVTSRPHRSAERIAKSLKLDSSYLVTNGGACVAEDIEDPLSIKRININTTLQLVEVLEQYDCHIRVLHESFAIGNKVRQKSQLIAKMTIGVGDPLFYPVSFVDSVYDRLMQEAIAPPKVQVQFFDEVEQESALKQVKDMVKGIKIASVNKGKVDIVSEDVSKLNGLQLVGQKLGISLQEMVAVGSYEDDIEMLEQVGLGVAMGNGEKSVKQVADWVTRSNDQNGVSYMIREVFRKQLRVQVE
ncbi:Cof-type HAD-IIB family hydrolase [Bacillus sp. FJAT-45037]|uniref:Cof-type HAD-IIB family hydrolase n=1 Tax=Bacillus sp. FJAT-45037 TaxID=2011007 RepID=UPI000C236919|nr:Cof-type HAD-IIB family hydrolase [Bacillus sp. FJAT-45037]